MWKHAPFPGSTSQPSFLWPRVSFWLLNCLLSQCSYPGPQDSPPETSPCFPFSLSTHSSAQAHFPLLSLIPKGKPLYLEAIGYAKYSDTNFPAGHLVKCSLLQCLFVSFSYNTVHSSEKCHLPLLCIQTHLFSFMLFLLMVFSFLLSFGTGILSVLHVWPQCAYACAHTGPHTF